MSKTIYSCSNCGHQEQRWQGRCNSCGEWNTFVEESLGSERKGVIEFGETAKALKISEIDLKNFKRIKVGLEELDRVFGGGIVLGSVNLLAGHPGIGKSTLVLQICSVISKNNHEVLSEQGEDKLCLYVSGEESPNQIKLRAERLGVKENFILFPELEVEKVIKKAQELKPKVLIIDSIQVLYSNDLPQAAGSVSQLQMVCAKLTSFAKKSNTSIILIGHVTKEGTVAGPKTIEHIVDAVFYLEGEKYHNLRILRGLKNRFGPTDEVGVFSMQEEGLEEVKNPSEIMLGQRLEAPGSSIAATIEGTRPFMVEIQSLTSATSFGYPKRASSGFDLGRLQLLVAVISKRIGLNLGGQDVYLNTTGGFKITEPAVDLPACLAIISAFQNKNIKKDLASFGEVGLSGEIRACTGAEKRIKEAEKLGFEKIVVPFSTKEPKNTKIKIIKIRSLKEAVKEAID